VAGVEQFRVAVPQATLTDLAERLARTRWPGALDGTGWEDGTSLAFLRDLVDWWQNGFDWRAQEAAINRFPQFRATVDGVRLHFVHGRGKGPAPLPGRSAPTNASRSRPRWPCSTTPVLVSGPSGPMATCAASPTCPAAATSRPWRNPSCWPRTYGCSSGLCGDPAQAGTRALRPCRLDRRMVYCAGTPNRA
jgi:hypothetical protein